MVVSLTNILELALQQGIWAALYIYLFFRMLSENKEREDKYQTIIDRLSGNIEQGIEDIQERLDKRSKPAAIPDNQSAVSSRVRRQAQPKKVRENGSMKRKKNIIDELAIRMGFEEVPDEEIIGLISENVQDLETGDRAGGTLLWHAVFCNRMKLTEWLIEHGANINTQDENDFSALHIAVQEKHIGMVSYLLGKGADVNIRDKFGNNPIMRTNRATPVEIFRILLENGADIDLKNIAGVSYRDISCAFPEMQEVLKEFE